jgi:hypothetical protein
MIDKIVFPKKHIARLLELHTLAISAENKFAGQASGFPRDTSEMQWYFIEKIIPGVRARALGGGGSWRLNIVDDQTVFLLWEHK